MSHEHCCSHGSGTPSVQQTLDELDFTRGVWSSAMDGEIDRVDKYLRDGGDPNALDSSGYAALHYAARSGHKVICESLLSHRADVNLQTRSGGATPLHRAAYQGHLEVTRLLVTRGADVTKLDTDGKSALHKAAERSRVEVCRYLAERDRSMLSVADTRGRRPVDCVTDNNTELVKLLATS